MLTKIMNNNMSKTQFEQLLENYNYLCRYCDAFFEKIHQIYNAEMKCQAGCDSCCELESVAEIEAFVIADFLENTSLKIIPNSGKQCVFLNEGRCQIYPVRPIICRTHGLILHDSFENLFSRTCNLNFSDREIDQFNPKHCLDSVNITENLIRLNMAFLQLTDQHSNPQNRIFLKDLL